MQKPLIFLDCETATLTGAPHLLELGALRVSDGEAQDHFVSLVRPMVEIDPGATEYHGITDEDVRDAPLTQEVLERFVEWAGDDWFVAHNAGSDAQILGFEFARYGIPAPEQPFLDTLKLAKRFLPDAPDHKLSTLCAFLELEEGNLHRALDDATYCWQVLEACVEEMESAPDATGLLGLCGTPVTIASAGPDPPRMSPRLRPLQRACDRGDSVDLLYGESSSAPAKLPVFPRMLFRRNQKSYLEAECERSGTLKTYRLDRIQRVFPR